MNLSERIKNVRNAQQKSQEDMARVLCISRQAYGHYETGKRMPPAEALAIIADALNTTTDYLLGRTDEQSNVPNVTDDYTTFPVIGEVAAGYDFPAIENWEGDTVDIPNSFLKGRNKEDFFVLRVKGDSMYPDYHDGDRVLVLRQTTMNYSGEVGVILYDTDYATLKKVEYVPGEDWMRLVAINPLVPPMKIINEDLERCRVLGIPKYLIREIEA